MPIFHDAIYVEFEPRKGKLYYIVGGHGHGELFKSDGNQRPVKLRVAVLEMALAMEWFKSGLSHCRFASNVEVTAH